MTLEQVLYLLGIKEVELFLLKQRVQTLEAALDSLTKAQSDQSKVE